jgi:hypothetical protein
VNWSRIIWQAMERWYEEVYLAEQLPKRSIINVRKRNEKRNDQTTGR